ncbi:MAG: GNAT superfamily N-acetyltransferase [Desulforhopalus sp.]|jgi:GNAT superfamily N-acetyltransferase
MIVFKSTHEKIIKNLEQELCLLKSQVRILENEKETTRQNILEYSRAAFAKDECVVFFEDKKKDFYICRYRKTGDQHTLIAKNLKYASCGVAGNRISKLDAKNERDFMGKNITNVFIQDIQMSEPDKDRGIGSFLLSVLKQLCLKEGVTTITGKLSQNDINTHGDRLFHFYQTNGFDIKNVEDEPRLEIIFKMNNEGDNSID